MAEATESQVLNADENKDYHASKSADPGHIDLSVLDLDQNEDDFLAGATPC
jgi:hypothetical protein